jgi:hypothetical protein|tara:strand:+ start:54 stop:206 length:153 start_codon:yes stop_codon:yes gene_type:complete
MGKTHINIVVDQKLHKELMLFKIKSDAGSLAEVIKKAIKVLKKHESRWRK